ADDDYIVGGDADRAQIDVTAPVAFAGFGVCAPELQGGGAKAEGELAGRIAVVLAGAPDARPDPGNLRSVQSDATNKWQCVKRAGAVGMITVRTAEQERVPWRLAVSQARGGGMVWLEGTRSGRVQAPVSATISAAASQRFFAFAGRNLAELQARAKAGN